MWFCLFSNRYYDIQTVYLKHSTSFFSSSLHSPKISLGMLSSLRSWMTRVKGAISSADEFNATSQIKGRNRDSHKQWYLKYGTPSDNYTPINIQYLTNQALILVEELRNLICVLILYILLSAANPWALIKIEYIIRRLLLCNFIFMYIKYFWDNKLMYN